MCLLKQLFCLLMLLVWSGAARAQLATSFYTVTGIEKRVLPNAVQIVIRTDGSVVFGGNLDEWIDIDENRFDLKRVSRLRIRLLRARANLPAFVDFGTYPVEGALITPGRDEFSNGFFPWNNYWPPDPRLDIELRFYVPILIRRFVVDRYGGQSSDNANEYGISFGNYLSPLEASVELGADRRSIVITVITDRADTGGGERMRRVKPETQKHRLEVTTLDVVPGATDEARLNHRLKLYALHTPLSEVLFAVSQASGVALTVREAVAELDVSLSLPDTTVRELLQALENAYGLLVAPRPASEGGGFLVGRGGPASETQRLPLKYLTPNKARLLFPDFLLPLMRVDAEHNALVVSGPPVMINRIRRDLETLDKPRQQVRVEAQVFEISRTEDFNFALSASYAGRNSGYGFDARTAQLTFNVQENEGATFRTALEALVVRGRARLSARPFSVVLSGEQSTLFLGQTRYITVLRSRGGQQEAQALQLQIGYALNVTPTVGASGEVLLTVAPRVSTVDALENGTGLPTLGIREINATLRVRDGDTVVLAGLDAQIDEGTRRRIAPAQRRNQSHTHLLVLVTARRVGVGAENKEQTGTPTPAG
jgi:hypothetical protein